MSTTDPAGRAATAAPIAYDGALTCALEVADFDRAVAWYRDALGFELEYRLDDIAWGEVRTHIPGVTIGIGESQEPKVEGGPALTFGVTDIAAARTHLESLGTRFDGETRFVADMVYLATFYDPDGNTFMLAQGATPTTR